MQKTKKINYIRKYRKILSLSIIVLLVIFTTAVPGVRGNTNEPEDTEGSAKVIGVSLASEQASYQQALGNLLEAEAEHDPNYQMTVQYAGWSISEQEKQLKTFIKEGVDAIILCQILFWYSLSKILNHQMVWGCLKHNFRFFPGSFDCIIN